MRNMKRFHKVPAKHNALYVLQTGRMHGQLAERVGACLNPSPTTLFRNPRVCARWKTLECIFLRDGFSFDRQLGDHRSYVKPRVLRSVIIPTYKEIDQDIIHANMRTAG